MVGITADSGLQQRSGTLKRQRDETDLREAEIEGGFQRRIDGGQQRLHHVVQEMAERHGEQHTEGGAFGGGRCGNDGGLVHETSKRNSGDDLERKGRHGKMPSPHARFVQMAVPASTARHLSGARPLPT